MKNRIISLAASLVAGAFTFFIHAVPANPNPVEMTMPDGHVLTVRIVGDEHFHFYETTDGYPMLFDEAGRLCYATIDADGAFARSAVPAHDVNARTVAEAAFLDGLDTQAVKKSLSAQMANVRKSVSATRTSAKSLLTKYPTTGSPKGLIILVEFSDQKFMTANALAEFTKLINEPGYSYNGATGSARDYFVENSRGLFTPEFDVYGPVTLPNSEAYYGRETANLRDANPYEMVAHACQLLDDQIDFAQYDEDGDGFVDNVFVFYAGYGQNSGASSETIWPHAANIWTYGGIQLILDGVQIGNYACTNEIQGNSGSVRAGIGTFCHEFSHVLGLPDLYPTDYSGAFSPGYFELMDTGPYLNNGNTPPYMSVYDRIELQWIVPRELNTAETVILKAFNDVEAGIDDEALLIKTPVSDDEYFLLENRQKTGWDAYIPGHGMLVWHIDYDAKLWADNHVNSTTYSQHLRVDIVEADNTTGEASYSGDPFPGTSNVTEFTDTSTPAMKTWTNIKVGKPITNIHEQDGVISFDILGGGERIAAVTALEATDITPTSFVANWQGRSEIFNYEVDLVRADQAVPLATYKVTTTSLTDCHLAISGLTPSTAYYYVVRAVSGDRISPNSARIPVTTLAPTFDMSQTVALPASQVEATRFTANWQALDGAESYILSVYTKQYITPTYDVIDFANGVSLPDGWFTNCTSTSAMAGTYGEAKPSLSMNTDNAILQSCTYDFDVNGFSFWYKGTSSVNGTLNIELLVNGQWQSFHSITVSDNTAATVSFDGQSVPPLPDHVRAFRLTFSRNSGTLYIDDVTVIYNGSATFFYVDGFENANVGNKTSASVANLQPETQYFYTVTAVQGSLQAMPSAEIAVTTGKLTAINDVFANGGISIAAVERGALVSNTSARDVQASVFDLAGRLIQSADVPAGAATVLHIDRQGAYIVKAGDKTVKMVIWK